MVKSAIIGDDLTGVNATGALFAKEGYKTFITSNTSFYDEKYDIIAFSTESRSMNPSRAYKIVYEAVDFFKRKDVNYFSKRIDSTLRGNISSEIDAVIDALEKNIIALVVPVWPSKKRVCVGGHLLLDMVPLEKTEITQDPKTPVHSTYVPEIIQKGSKYHVGLVPLKDVLKGEASVKKSINDQREKGKRIIVIDATDKEDIKTIANASEKLSFKTVSVDPGPFSYMKIRKHLNDVKQRKQFPKKKPKGKALAVVGSVTRSTRSQIKKFEEETSSEFIQLNTKALLSKKPLKKEIDRVTGKVNEYLKNNFVVGIATAKTNEDVIDLEKLSKKRNSSKEDISQQINKALARLGGEILRKNLQIKGLYLSGGDITKEILNEIQVEGIEVIDEIEPLTVFGKIIQKGENYFVITKGGLIGDERTMIRSINYLLDKI